MKFSKPRSTPSSRRPLAPSFPSTSWSCPRTTRPAAPHARDVAAELAASIKDSGVLQNLVVVQAARGRYEVCAGGRRLAALTLLVQQGDIADNYPVPVLVVPADKALIASLPRTASTSRCIRPTSSPPSPS